jgi:hypothetical protein
MRPQPPVTPVHFVTGPQVWAAVIRRLRGTSDAAWLEAVGSVERDVQALKAAYPRGDWRMRRALLLAGDVPRQRVA